jgi:hypothetical protein
MKSQYNQSAIDFSIQCGWELLDTAGFTAMLGVKFCPWCGLKMPTFKDMLASLPPMTEEQKREQKINWVVGMTHHNPTFVAQVLDNMECTKSIT